MKLDLSYRQIWKISAPIMLGSAAQNVIALSDAVLLYHLGEVEFAAIGFVGVFYITIAAIGYSFSRGGQIIIARRMGEGKYGAVGHIFHTMLLFELALAALMWAFMRFGTAWFFQFFLENSPQIYDKCLEYIHYRSYGIFFSYAGVALISLYTGIARPGIILLDTIILAIVNLALNYGLIFGKFGLPAMGIGGSGLASSIAEGIAFVVFIVFILLDKKNRVLNIFSVPKPDWALTRQQLNISLPVVAHAAVGQGSWIFFFGMVENLGERALAISNLARTVYLLLSIPLWGFSSGVNTLVSNLIGQARHSDVLAAAWKTGKLCWLVSMAMAIPVLFFPGKVLYPLLGKSDMTLIGETQPIFYLMLGILSFATFGSVMVNSLSGTGATWFGLRLQVISLVVYLIYIFTVVNVLHSGLFWVWGAEIVYWSVMILMVVYYLRSERWHGMEF
ncbi:MAG TPA: MATE family efflux transporter [Saprospiraceae bacterium]|nr:MATE family efflux transporter [Saprospiraceae bacterium]HPI07728.1 MATE family efflux transporter [Saprospiraceae bacterium]